MIEERGDGYGELACREVVRSMEAAAVSERTKNYMRRCLPGLSSGVEMLCPATMGVSRTGMLATAYGPGPATAKGLPVVIATMSGYMSTVVDKWPTITKTQQQELGSLENNELWYVIGKAVDKKDTTLALLALRAKMGEYLITVRKATRTIRARKHTPFLIVLAAYEDFDNGDTYRAAGMSQLIELSANVLEQLKRQDIDAKEQDFINV